MAFDTLKQWGRDEWQEHVENLLRMRYGDGYISIPHQHTGDSGIEGYCVEGNAYQAYAPDEMCSAGDLAKKQKDKITADIGKFINNEAKLKALIYQTKISKWMLVVPRHVSQEVVAHANKKADEVRACNLPYVDSENFRVLVKTREDFAAEEKAIVKLHIQKIPVGDVAAKDGDVEKFESNQLDFIKNIVVKLLKLPNATAENVNDARRLLVRRFIAAENILRGLKEDYPEQYERLITLRTQREEDLRLESLSDVRPSLDNQVERFLPNLEEYGVLHPDHNKTIAWGAVSDWLMRCPLDFK